MKVESAALLGPEPTLDGRALVSAVIVHDKVNIQIGWYFLFQFVEEPDELPAAMAGQAAPHHFPVHDIACASEAGAEPRSRRGRKPRAWPEPSGATARFAEQ